MHEIWLHDMGSSLWHQAGDCPGEEGQLEQRANWGVEREATGLKVNIKTDFLEAVVRKQVCLY